MGHQVEVLDKFGNPKNKISHRRYEQVVDIYQILHPKYHLPDAIKGRLIYPSWMADAFAEEDRGVLIVDQAAPGEEGFFELQDLEENVACRARLIEILGR